MNMRKRILAALLATVIAVSAMLVPGVTPVLKASAVDITLGGITQTRVVTDYETTYPVYEKLYYNGYGQATDLVLPGLSAADDYTPQGMAYYADKGWVLVTAYDNSGGGGPTVIYAIDIASGDFVALFRLKKTASAYSTAHGGGIAASEKNLYFADSGSTLSYFPLSEMDVAPGTVKDVVFAGTVNLAGELNGASTSYCSYDDGVLWTGNFYFSGSTSYDTVANSQYNSMIFGYQLKGDTSADEWNNLINGGGKGSAGNPSYCLALGNTYDRIQYSLVSNGRLYLSRSYSRKPSTNHIKELTVFDIDLAVPGTTTLTVNGTERTDCYLLEDGTGTAFLAPYMGEAICAIDDYIYMTFESAAYTYMAKTATNVCPEPIDVVWKIDPYALLGLTREDDGSVAETYQRVYNLDEISSSDQYIIAYESSLTDPSSGQKILYALDAFGGYDGRKFTKQISGTQANTGDTFGVIGHPITDYYTVNGFLYLNNAEEDDAASLRWRIAGLGSASLRLQNKSLYYAEYKNFYMGSRLMYMTTNEKTGLDNIKLEQYGGENSGTFRIFYEGNGNYYLWCNDGSNQSYIDTYTAAYQAADSSKAYAGLTEVPGTFHSDGDGSTAIRHANSGNLINQSTTSTTTRDAVGLQYELLHIYKRVNANVSSNGQSNLVTGLNAELQADGTYTVTLDAYATGSTQKYASESGKPTDFVFVLDESASMTTSDCYEYTSHSGALTWNNLGSNKYFYDATNQRYYQIYQDRTWAWFDYTYYMYYDDSAGTRHWLLTNGSTTTNQSSAAQGGGPNDACYNGTYFQRDSKTRLQAMKDSVINFIAEIDADAKKYNVTHRVSIVQYGQTGTSYSYTGMYTNAGTSMVQYSDTTPTEADYAKAFYDPNHDNVRTIINNLPATEDTGTYVNHGFDMAYNILNSTGRNYGSDGAYSACVILLTDGVPGDGNSTTEATNSANSAITFSKSIKDMGGRVFSVQLGSDTSLGSFNMTNFMNYISSNYPSAQSMTSGGESQSTAFYHSVALTADLAINQVLDGVFERINQEFVTTGTEITLGTSAVLLGALGDAFKMTSSSKVSVSTADIYYDSLNRLYEAEPVAASLSASADPNTNTVSVWGFNYSDNYLANSHQGKKIIVTVSGVLLNVASGIGLSVSDSQTAAIYENTSAISSAKPTALFPGRYFNVPEDSYVLDYGVDMELSSPGDVFESIATAPVQQSNYTKEVSDGESNLTASSGSLKMSLAATCSETQTKYVLTKKSAGGYEWRKINLTPASNVLFEESSFTASPLAGASSWSSVGESTVSSQSLSTSSDIYGYDTAYSSSAADFSGGTALSAAVSSETRRSQTASFTFTGTGFDLISACGANTGIQMVTVKKADSGELIKAYIIDTYYSDGTYLTNSLLRQVPILNFTGDYGTYLVETTALYLTTAAAMQKSRSVMSYSVAAADEEISAFASQDSNDYLIATLSALGIDGIESDKLETMWFDSDSVLCGGTGNAAAASPRLYSARSTGSTSLVSYIDGIRIYNPMENQSAYLATEQNAKYINVINELASSSEDITGATDKVFAYIEGSSAEEVDFATYQNNLYSDDDGSITRNSGPKNELYLAGNANALITQGVTFTINNLSSDSRVMLSVRGVTPMTQVTVSSTAKSGSFTPGGTEMYYDITDFIDINGGSAIVTIANSGSGLLAINNLKLVNANAAPAQARSLFAARALMAAPAAPVEINTSAPTTPDYSDYVPNKDCNGGTDFDLDPVGDPETTTETEKETETENEDTNGTGTFVQRVITFFTNIFEKIKTIFSAFSTAD